METSDSHRVLALFDGALGERLEPRIRESPYADVVDIRSDRDVIDELPQTDAGLVFSAGFRHIIPEDVIEATDARLVNAHISYLPHGRGANPNVWAIADDEPAGVTLHELTAGVDAGGIIAQRRVPKYPDDDGRDLYERLITAMDGLVLEHIDDLLTGDYVPREQPGGGSHHYSSEFDDLCELDLDETVRVGDLLRRLQALTYAPYDNAFFYKEDVKYNVSISVDRNPNE